MSLPPLPPMGTIAPIAGLDLRETQQEISTSNQPASAQCNLRSSCDLCYSSKLRCTREKPTCTRCQKFGITCVYSPTKRPGRPRRVHIAGTAAATISKRNPSLSHLSSKNSNQNLDQPPNHEFITLPSPSYDPMISQPLKPPHAPSTEPPWDITGDMWEDASIDSYIEALNNPTNSEVGAAGLLSGAVKDTEMLTDGSLLTPFTMESIIMLPDDRLMLTPEEHSWSAGLELTREREPIVIDEPTESESSSQGPRTSPAASDLLPSGLDRFLDQCNTLKRDASSASGSLTLLANQAVIGMPLTPATTTSNSISPNMQCLCHIALVNLQCHRHNLNQMRPEGSLETCLHLQRILCWTWTMHRECFTCRNDMLAILNVTCITRQVVHIYYNIIAGQARERYDQGIRPAGPSSTIEFTRLSLGTKLIQGTSKANALSHLMGLKLRQMRNLLDEFQSHKFTEPSSDITESIQLLISGVLERISVATGMLSTLR